MVKVLDCKIIVSKLELPSCDYLHFWTKILEKGMNPLILPAMG